jgi:hypothetical protein
MWGHLWKLVFPAKCSVVMLLFVGKVGDEKRGTANHLQDSGNSTTKAIWIEIHQNVYQNEAHELSYLA